MISLHIMIPYCSGLSGHHRVVYCSLGIVASLLAMLAGFYQLRTWLPYMKGHRDRRKPSSQPHIVVCWSFANIVACVGTLLLSLSVLITEDRWRDVQVPFWSTWPILAQIVANFGYVSSCLWTSAYLVDVLLQLRKWDCWMEVYHGFCWIGGVVITTGFQVVRYQHGFNYSCRRPELRTILASSWLAVIAFFILLDVAILMILTERIKCQLFNLTNTFTAPQHHMFMNIRLKFLLVVTIFIVCWTPTLLSTCTYLLDANLAYTTRFYFLEVLVNPLQEFFNCFLFTPKLRKSRDESSPLREAFVYNSAGSIRNMEGSVESVETCVSHGAVAVVEPAPFQFTPVNGDSEVAVQMVLSHDSLNSSDYLNFSFEGSVHVGLVYGTA